MCCLICGRPAQLMKAWTTNPIEIYLCQRDSDRWRDVYRIPMAHIADNHPAVESGADHADRPTTVSSASDSTAALER